MKTRKNKSTGGFGVPHRSRAFRSQLDRLIPGIDRLSDVDGFAALWEKMVRFYAAGLANDAAFFGAVYTFTDPRGLKFSLSDELHSSGAPIYELSKGGEVIASFSAQFEI
jgi:hypothetical protein